MSLENPPSLHPYRVSQGYLEYSIISGVLALVASLCVIVRFVHQSRIGDLWWDDWTILGGLVFGLGVFICNILISLPSLGAAGYPINTYSIEQLRLWAKIALAAEVLYNPSVSLARISILLFYWRIFNLQGRALVAARILFLLLVAQFFTSVFGLIFSFNPVEAQWIITVPHTTIDIKAFYIATAGIKVFLDVGLIWIAQRQLYTLRLDKKHKLLLSGLFFFSAVTIIASIFRIGFIAVADLDNGTESFKDSGIWLNFEMFLAVINACLPAMYSFFRAFTIAWKANKGRSTPSRNDIPGRSHITIRSTSARFKRRGENTEHDIPLRNTGYQVICESGGERDSHSMAPLAQVWIDTEFRVEDDNKAGNKSQAFNQGIFEGSTS